MQDADHEENEDLGFGEKFTSDYARLLNEDGSFNIQREGSGKVNVFKTLINMSWPKFFGYFIILYVTINFGFALLYLAGGEGSIQNLSEGNLFVKLEELFYFSVQTFTTVGYGKLNPISTYANILATFNAFSGLMFFALVTGLFFSKFSTPIDHIRYSKNIIIDNYKGSHALMMRIVNELDNHIMNLNARITMSWINNENEDPRRKFAQLPLEIDSIYLFPLNWTLVHKIDERSPLYGKSKEDLMNTKAEFIIMIHGYDRTYSKEIHSGSSYVCKDLIYGAHFNTMYESKNNQNILHIDQIDDLTIHNFNKNYKEE
jgi:inward rectifier potassium channel